MISSQKSLFNIPDNVIFLNTAYMSPLLNSVVDAIDYGTRLKAKPWKIKISDFYENTARARNLFSKIVSTSSNCISIIPSASYGIETAAKNLKVSPSHSILLLENQFPSNVYPWIRLAKLSDAKVKFVGNSAELDLTENILQAIDEKCDIVALPNVLWTNGELINLFKVKEKCTQNDTQLVLDLTQSAGAMWIDLDKLEPDFAVIASYKWMLGPYSTGFLYVHPKHHHGNPLEEGWITKENSRNFSQLTNYANEYESGAIRYDMGERANFSLMPGVIKALEQILIWGVKNIEKTLEENNNNLSTKIGQLGLKTIPSNRRGPHFLSVKLPLGVSKNLISKLEMKGIYLSERAGSLRITPHLWNTREDFDYFIDELSINL